MSKLITVNDNPPPQIKYVVKIIGNTWGGYKATFEKTFSSYPVPSLFGDFEKLCDYEITKVEILTSEGWCNEKEFKRTVIDEMIVKEWDTYGSKHYYIDSCSSSSECFMNA